ncbi:MAG: rubrerythrin family protein [Methanosarcinales archaeon]|nr:MAG: rubrerythrin family protein [Methanosarcinales archaeon]
MTTKKELEANFKGETTEVGLYLAMSKQAEREGHHTAAMYFRQVAMDEAWHAAEIVELLGMIKDTRSNLEMMLKGETMAETEKANAAKKAEAENMIDAARFFGRASKDEARHKAGLKGILMRFEAHGW